MFQLTQPKKIRKTRTRFLGRFQGFPFIFWAKKWDFKIKCEFGPVSENVPTNAPQKKLEKPESGVSVVFRVFLSFFGPKNGISK